MLLCFFNQWIRIFFQFFWLSFKILNHDFFSCQFSWWSIVFYFIKLRYFLEIKIGALLSKRISRRWFIIILESIYICFMKIICFPSTCWFFLIPLSSYCRLSYLNLWCCLFLSFFQSLSKIQVFILFHYLFILDFLISMEFFKLFKIFLT